MAGAYEYTGVSIARGGLGLLDVFAWHFGSRQDGLLQSGEGAFDREREFCLEVFAEICPEDFFLASEEELLDLAPAGAESSRGGLGVFPALALELDDAPVRDEYPLSLLALTGVAEGFLKLPGGDSPVTRVDRC